MIIKAENYQPDARIFALFIGRSKSGKSAAAASFPKPYQQLDFDGRFDGVANTLKTNGGFLDPDGITYERYFAKNGFNPLQATFDKWDMQRATNQFEYKSIEIASAGSLIRALISSSHELQSGKKVGKLRMSGPGDYNFEVTGTGQIFDYLGMLPCHVIMSAHIIDKYGKPHRVDASGKPIEYEANEVIGEKLNLRDQPGENLLSMFGNVFRFEKEIINNEAHYFVEFNTDIADNTFGIPPGRFDITRKPFYPFLQELIKSIKEGTFKSPQPEFKPFTFGQTNANT